MTRRKRTIVVVSILCAMFFCTIRVQAEEKPSNVEVEEQESSIVVQLIRMETAPYVYRNGKVEQVGEAREEILPYYITDAYETIGNIATNLGVSVEELLAVNENLKTLQKNAVYPSLMYTAVRIPEIDWSKVSSKIYYYVEEGDNLWSISNYFGIEISDIVKCNNQEVSIGLNDEKDSWKAIWKLEPTEIKETVRMISAKQTMYLMNYPEDSTWWICREITNPDLIYAGDFIRIK